MSLTLRGGDPYDETPTRRRPLRGGVPYEEETLTSALPGVDPYESLTRRRPLRVPYQEETLTTSALRGGDPYESLTTRSALSLIDS